MSVRIPIVSPTEAGELRVIHLPQLVAIPCGRMFHLRPIAITAGARNHP
jgi:hypothetical protein